MTETDTTPVVVEPEVREEAYEMGYNRYQDLDIALYESEEDFEVVTDSAGYANHTLPTLRCMAGYGDGGYGTYQVERDVVIVHEADLDDRPIEGEMVESHYLFTELVDEFHEGAYQAFMDQFED